MTALLPTDSEGGPRIFLIRIETDCQSIIITNKEIVFVCLLLKQFYVVFYLYTKEFCQFIRLTGTILKVNAKLFGSALIFLDRLEFAAPRPRRAPGAAETEIKRPSFMES